MKFARIAQMESSRIVGGRAQTQALLRAPDLTSRAGATGISHQPGSRGDTQYFAGNEIPLPSGSIASPVTVLKSLNLANALLDGVTVVGGLIALVVFFGSLPLAVGLMLFGVL